MGADKARLELGGRSLVAWSLEALGGAVEELVLASGPEARFADLGVEEVPDLRPRAGPLAGLETALAAARERGCSHAAVLACDMPHVRAELVRELVTRALRERCDVLVGTTVQGLEPLFGVYSVRCLPAVRAALDAGERRAVAFHDRAVEGSPLRVEGVALEELGAGPEAVRNLNTPADLERARGEARFRFAPDSGKAREGQESGGG